MYMFACSIRRPRYVTTVPAASLRLFLMMGREIEPIDSVPAGNVFGIAGLEKHILASATVSTLPRYQVRSTTIETNEFGCACMSLYTLLLVFL